MLPASVAYVGSLIVDAVVAAMRSGGDAARVVELVALEGVLVALIAAAQRALSLCQSLLRAQLGQRVNVMILEKALTLELQHFEDSEFYDKLTRARREASTRPLSLVTRTFGLVQNAISLASYGVLLAHFSPWAVAVLLLAGLPAFVAEAKFSGDAFRLFRWRSPETRMQIYLETVLAREDHAKEVKLFGLGPRLLERYRDIFQRLYGEDRALTVRRDAWGFCLGLIGTAALYGAYAWIAISTVRRADHPRPDDHVPGALSAGAVGGVGNAGRGRRHVRGQPVPVDAVRVPRDRSAPDRRHRGARPGPRGRHPLRGRELHLPRSRAAGARPRHAAPAAGREPGAGGGERLGQDHAHQAPDAALRADRRADPARRPGSRGVGPGGAARAHRRHLPGLRPLPDAVSARTSAPATSATSKTRRAGATAANKGRASEFIETLPAGYHTQLGKWFKDGRELSGGQWQKIALSRAFMRTRADILVLDEPTAAMDAQAEAEVFEHFRQLAHDRITILISHRFSTVRMADQIAVLNGGHIVERGRHEELMRLNGRYAHLFTLQARGYR